MSPQRSTPKERVEAAHRRWGEQGLMSLCIETLTWFQMSQRDQPTDSPSPDRSVTPSEQMPPQQVDGPLLELAMELGGLTDRDWLFSGNPPRNRYWPRVWAIRAFLYVWDDLAAMSVVNALGDEHWRVREMAAKVIVLRELPDAGDQLVELIVDEVPRVRAAACRALAVVGEGEHAAALVEASGENDPLVRRAAERALDTLSQRLDWPL